MLMITSLDMLMIMSLGTLMIASLDIMITSLGMLNDHVSEHANDHVSEEANDHVSATLQCLITQYFVSSTKRTAQVSLSLCRQVSSVSILMQIYSSGDSVQL